MKNKFSILGLITLTMLSVTSCSHTHQYDLNWKSDENYHWHECLNEGCDEQIIDKSAHKGGNATESSLAKCEVCNKEYGSLVPHVHSFSQNIVDSKYLATEATCTKLATYYTSCLCGEIGTTTFEGGNYKEHQMSQWEIQSDATCTENEVKYRTCLDTSCNYKEVIDGQSALNHSLNTKYDANNHWEECDRENCEYTTEKQPHSGGNASCVDYASCTTCNQPYGEKLDHNHSIVVALKDGHYYKCECNDSLEIVSHNYSMEVVTVASNVQEGKLKYTCIDCKYEIEETLYKIKGSVADTYPSLSNADVVTFQGNIYTYGGSPDGWNRTNEIYCYNTYSKVLYKLDVKLAGPSTSHRVVLHNEKVYIFGGTDKGIKYDTIQVHDLKNNTITTLDCKMPWSGNCFQTGYYNDKFYLIGGSTSEGNSNKIYEFDFDTNTFKKLEVTIPTVIFKGAWISVDKYAYIMGGTNGKRLTSIYRFNMETLQIEEMNAKLPYEISQSRLAYLDGKIYVFGGTNEANELVDDIFVYDVKLDTLTQFEVKLPLNLANTCVGVINNSIFILGGDNASTNIILKLTNNQISNELTVL